ncbi:MerR family transcriptional regulator [Patescibacteria group bacterium]|nr:MerR family transcriptional regulator [Patescibacteria group bacterium]MDE1941036.1 MerR family transcriptional regulator [Patescibacteria group bacterium]
MEQLQIKLLTIKKAAAILGVTPLTLRNWDNSGKFQASRHPINNYRVYKLADVERLLMEIEASKGKRINKKQARKLVVQHLAD